MARMRQHNKPPFVQIPNDVAFDSEMSFRARGVLVYLLAKPSGWDVRSEAIARDGKEGRDAVRAALRELAARGYYRIVRVLKGGRGGTWHTFTDVSFKPVPEWAAEYAANGDKPAVVKGSAAASYFEDPHTRQRESPEDGFSGPGPKPENPDSGRAGSGRPGSIERPVTEDGDKEDFLPAVGEVQHRRAPASSGLRPGNEDRPDEEVQPRALVRVADIGAVYASLPEQVRAQIGVEASPRVVDAIRAELVAGTRTVAQLVERVARRWDGWQRLGEPMRDPVGLAVTLVQRRHCPDVWCEDGQHLETGQECVACAGARSRPAAVPAPPVVVPGPRPRPDDGTVAEVLAPVPYVPEPGDPVPARRVVGRVPSGPPPGVLEAARAQLHRIRGVHRRPAGTARELAGVGA